MPPKSYLTDQIRLITLDSKDLFTDEEQSLYQKIIDLTQQINELKKKEDFERKTLLIHEKREIVQQLQKEIKKHDGIPRTVNLKNVLDSRTYEGDQPKGISWRTLRVTRKIAEFCSEESEKMGLNPNDVTYDKIILKWKSESILRQCVLDGFYVSIDNPDGSVTTKHYYIVNASAGQLRRDKVQCLSDNIWEKIKGPFQCGLTWDVINRKKPINISKILAYTSLMSSSTCEWKDITIDQCIVIPDFKGKVTGLVDFINPDYTIERGERTVEINHIDGAGIYISDNADDLAKGVHCNRNKMVRGPYIKGLISPFDVLAFCEEHGVPPEIEDIWGLKHNLVEENIKVLFTASQFKMNAYYDSWDEYKTFFKENNCKLRDMNYEEDFIKDCPINYQMLQTLLEMTDDEISAFTARTHQKISGIAKNKQSMLRTLRADEDSDHYFCKALALYEELLRDGYARKTLQDIKKRWIYDARSGRIVCQNKRLYVIPDLYAACEFWFLHIENPKGLLENGEVGCMIYRSREKVDCLRSPSLYFEHAVRRVSKNPEVYRWFRTNGIYTSCHDLISRVLQFDCDGDQLNVVAESVIIDSAERTRDKYGVVPLFYDANSAPGELVSRETLYEGIIRAHNNSGIGMISNHLTILWNRENPDFKAAALLCYYNNQMIDGAKTGEVNSYESYPEALERISKAIGGKRSRLPYFFQYSQNGRKQKIIDSRHRAKKKAVSKINNSTVNRICARFDDIQRIDPNFAGVAPFNWQMLMEGDVFEYNQEAINLFGMLDDKKILMAINEGVKTSSSAMSDDESKSMMDLMIADAIEVLEDTFGSLETIYPSVAKYLFSQDAETKTTHKKFFWNVFGDIAVRNLIANLKSCTTCPTCGMRIPAWSNTHNCSKVSVGQFKCIDCGTIVDRINSRQTRCQDCQKEYRRISKARLDAERNARNRLRKRAS